MSLTDETKSVPWTESALTGMNAAYNGDFHELTDPDVFALLRQHFIETEIQAAAAVVDALCVRADQLLDDWQLDDWQLDDDIARRIRAFVAELARRMAA